MTKLETRQAHGTCNCSKGIVYIHQTGSRLNLRFTARKGPGRLQSALQLTAAQQERNNKERLQRITVLNQVLHWRCSRPHTLGMADAERSCEGSDPHLQRQTSQRPGTGNDPKYVDDIPPHEAATAATRISHLPIGPPRMATSRLDDHPKSWKTNDIVDVQQNICK